jgi:hypothetical protein
MDDTTLIATLHTSCTRQLSLYTSLQQLTQKLLQQVILGRGDLRGIAESFHEKQALIQSIDEERSGAREAIELWQQRKQQLADTAGARELSELFGSMEKIICQFLESEVQLQCYLEHAIGQDCTS